MKQLTLAEQLAYSTVRIECTFPDKSIATGTGFVFTFAVPGTHIAPAIVTNNHLMFGAERAQFHVHVVSKPDELPTGHAHYTVDHCQNWVCSHPDPKVDLCILPLASLIDGVQAKGLNMFYKAIDPRMVPSQSE